MRLLLLLALVLPAAAQTLLVGSAATPTLAGSYSVAPGSLTAAVPRGGGLPAKDTSTIRLTLQVRGATQVFNSTVLAADAEMVLAVLPSAVPIGWMDVTLTAGGVTSTGRVYISRSSVSLFSAIRDGSGPAIAQNIGDNSLPSLNQLTNPAIPGQYMTVWGTGIGDFTTADVTVDVYGMVVKPTFAGHAPGIPGLDQINFRLPAGTPSGCYVPVTVTVAGEDVSNSVTVATAGSTGSGCVHPLGLSVAQLKTLDQGGTVVLGEVASDNQVYVSEKGGFERSESVSAYFQVANSLRAFSGPMAQNLASPVCSLSTLSTFGSIVYLPVPPIPGSLTYGDAGQSVTLTGPDAVSVPVPAQVPGQYFKRFELVNAPTIAKLPNPVAVSGAWTFTAPGGTPLEAFQRNFTLISPLRWTNRDTFTIIDRNVDLVITWEPRPEAGNDVVTVHLTSFSAGPILVGPGQSITLGISCRTAERAGQLVIPREWLQKVEITPSGGSSALSLSSDTQQPAQFSVPLKAGGTAPVAVSRSSSESIPVTVR